MEVKYTIKEVKPNIFAVIVKDSYDRAMLFCRTQEFYESPNSKFRGKNFSIWDYMKWYSMAYGKGFSYGSDWGGFNIPFEIVEKCQVMNMVHETPYDRIMQQLYVEISNRKKKGKAYIIGTDTTDSNIFTHELCHGLWYIETAYKKKAKKALQIIAPEHYAIFKTNLLNMGYTHSVIDDEIQAYLTTDWSYPKFYTGVEKEICEKYRQVFDAALSEYLY